MAASIFIIFFSFPLAVLINITSQQKLTSLSQETCQCVKICYLNERRPHSYSKPLDMIIVSQPGKSGIKASIFTFTVTFFAVYGFSQCGGLAWDQASRGW